VKKVDGKRLDDCIQSLDALKMLDKTVHFICRMPDDIKTLDGVTDGAFIYNGKVFNFVDISAFTHSMCVLLSVSQIMEVINELHNFIEKIDRPVVTKNGWNTVFS
jgi:hypothetical protein